MCVCVRACVAADVFVVVVVLFLGIIVVLVSDF